MPTEKYQPFASKMREDLLRKLKLLSAAEGKPMMLLLEEAVTQYLSYRKFSQETLEVRESGARYSVSFDVPADKQGNKEDQS